MDSSNFSSEAEKREFMRINREISAMNTNPARPADPLAIQVGGAHYKGKAIQPVEYIHANKLGFLEGCIVKRITRWKDKGSGIEDLEKIKHEVDLLIAMEQKYPSSFS